MPTLPERLSHVWEDRFQDALEEVLSMPDSTADDLTRVIWNEGILERISPSSTIEAIARRSCGKDVFKGRNDPEMYRRIIYSALHAAYVAENNLSWCGYGLAAGSVTRASVLALYRNRAKDFFPEYNPDHFNRFFGFVVGKIVERANRELERLGIPRPGIIPIGSQGMFEGIEVRVECYHDSGNIVLKASTSTYEDHERLGKTNNWSVLFSPSRLNPDNFHI